MSVNLEELEALERAATPGEWEADSDREYVFTKTPPAHLPVFEKTDTTYCVMRWPADWDGLPESSDLRLVLALRNAAVPMIQELRELREENARAIAWLDRMSWANATIDTKTTSKGPLEIQLADALAERDALRAEVEWLKTSVDALNRTANEYADAARETESGKREMVLEEQLVAARAQLATATRIEADIHGDLSALDARLNDALVTRSFCDENKADLRAHRDKLEQERDLWMARAMSMGWGYSKP